MMLDSPRFGARGNYGGSTGTEFVQDLYVGYQPFRDVNIEAGFLYMPLTRGSLASNTQVQAVEGPGDILFYPLSRGSRETGVQFRGLLFDRLIYLRGGVYEGARFTPPATGTPPPAVNPQGTPEVAGMVRFNFVGEETGYSFPGIYLDGKTGINVGVGGQYQPHSGDRQGTTANYYDYSALAADVFFDLALAVVNVLLVGAGLAIALRLGVQVHE